MPVRSRSCATPRQSASDQVYYRARQTLQNEYASNYTASLGPLVDLPVVDTVPNARWVLIRAAQPAFATFIGDGSARLVFPLATPITQSKHKLLVLRGFVEQELDVDYTMSSTTDSANGPWTSMALAQGLETGETLSLHIREPGTSRLIRTAGDLIVGNIEGSPSNFPRGAGGDLLTARSGLLDWFHYASVFVPSADATHCGFARRSEIEALYASGDITGTPPTDFSGTVDIGSSAIDIHAQIPTVRFAVTVPEGTPTGTEIAGIAGGYTADPPRFFDPLTGLFAKFMVTDHDTARLEYRQYDIGTHSYVEGVSSVEFPLGQKFSFEVVLVFPWAVSLSVCTETLDVSESSYGDNVGWTGYGGVNDELDAVVTVGGGTVEYAWYFISG